MPSAFACSNPMWAGVGSKMRLVPMMVKPCSAAKPADVLVEVLDLAQLTLVAPLGRTERLLQRRRERPPIEGDVEVGFPAVGLGLGHVGIGTADVGVGRDRNVSYHPNLVVFAVACVSPKNLEAGPWQAISSLPWLGTAHGRQVAKLHSQRNLATLCAGSVNRFLDRQVGKVLFGRVFERLFAAQCCNCCSLQEKDAIATEAVICASRTLTGRYSFSP